MIPFLIYLVVILILIYKNGFFGLFNDSVISSKQLSILFFLKCLAIPVFYFVYELFYGGIEKFDSGKFYQDASIISHIAKNDFLTYLKFLFGLQNDRPGSYDFLLVQNTMNWDNGEIKDFQYNDNRVLIRIHSLIHFLSFGSFFVHALFSCFISFIGLFYLYKTFKNYFFGKEIWILILVCLFPALWFYTGAPLKEGVSVFVMGASLLTLKKLFTEALTVKRILIFFFLLWISLLLKPYLLFFTIISFSLFFAIEKYWTKKLKIAPYVFVFAGLLFFLNFLSIGLKHKSLPEAALTHQRIFSGVSKGGFFLTNDEKFIRLAYDSSQIKEVNKTQSIYTVQKGVSYMYWNNSEAHDTLYCDSNTDTLTRYRLAYRILPNNSNLEPIIYSEGFFSLVVNCSYYSLAYPLFFNAKNALQYLASFENLVILMALLIIILGFFKNKKDTFLPSVFLLFALGICLLIGIATPNSGAIFRYRSPAMIFVLMAALYYVDLGKFQFFRQNP